MVIQRKANLVVLLNHGAFFKQYHVREAKLPPQAAGQNHRKSRRNNGLERWQTRRSGQQGVSWQHQVDPACWRCRLTLCIRCRMRAHPNLDQPPPPVGLGLAAADVEELSSLVNNRHACHHYRLKSVTR